MEKRPSEVIMNGDGERIELPSDEFTIPIDGYDDINFTYVITVPYTESENVQEPIIHNLTLDDISFTATEVKYSPVVTMCNAQNSVGDSTWIDDATESNEVNIDDMKYVPKVDPVSMASHVTATSDCVNVVETSDAVIVPLVLPPPDELPLVIEAESPSDQSIQSVEQKLPFQYSTIDQRIKVSDTDEAKLPDPSLLVENSNMKPANEDSRALLKKESQECKTKTPLNTTNSSLENVPLADCTKSPMSDEIQNTTNKTPAEETGISGGLKQITPITYLPIKLPTKGYGKKGAVVLTSNVTSLEKPTRNVISAGLPAMKFPTVPLKRRRLIIDTHKQIPINEFKLQLRDTQDILRGRKELPLSRPKRLVGLGLEKTLEFIARHGRVIPSKRLARRHTTHLQIMSKNVTSSSSETPSSTLLNNDLVFPELTPTQHDNTKNSQGATKGKSNHGDKETIPIQSVIPHKKKVLKKIKTPSTQTGLTVDPLTVIPLASNSVHPKSQLDVAPGPAPSTTSGDRPKIMCYSRKKQISKITQEQPISVSVPTVFKAVPAVEENVKALDHIVHKDSIKTEVEVAVDTQEESQRVSNENKPIILQVEPKSDALHTISESMELDLPYLPNHPKTETDHILEGTYAHLAVDDVLPLWNVPEIQSSTSVEN